MSPSVNKVNRIIVRVTEVCGGLVFILHGIGRRRTISKSKRINRMATRKNWMEIGDRASPSGSNPHSYGDSLLISGLITISALIV